MYIAWSAKGLYFDGSKQTLTNDSVCYRAKKCFMFYKTAIKKSGLVEIVNFSFLTLCKISKVIKKLIYIKKDRKQVEYARKEILHE